MRVTETITIHAPVEQVFAVFADLEHAAERIAGIDAVEVLEGPANLLAVGTRWRETRTMMGKAATETMWVTQVTPPRGYVVAAESHGTRYRSAFTFEPNAQDAAATDATMTFEGTPVTLTAKLMMPLGLLFCGALRKMIRRDLADLKAACEAMP